MCFYVATNVASIGMRMCLFCRETSVWNAQYVALTTAAFLRVPDTRSQSTATSGSIHFVRGTPAWPCAWNSALPKRMLIITRHAAFTDTWMRTRGLPPTPRDSMQIWKRTLQCPRVWGNACWTRNCWCFRVCTVASAHPKIVVARSVTLACTARFVFAWVFIQYSTVRSQGHGVCVPSAYRGVRLLVVEHV